jgi:hypothetical protein
MVMELAPSISKLILAWELLHSEATIEDIQLMDNLVSMHIIIPDDSLRMMPIVQE